MPIVKILKRIRLNLRAVKLALTGCWLTPGDVAASYDALAATYRDNWLTHLCCTTNRLHELLPEQLLANSSPPQIIDLGCGTGYSTAFLAQKYLTADITAVDISAEMLNQAKLTVGNVLAAGNKNSSREQTRNSSRERSEGTTCPNGVTGEYAPPGHSVCLRQTAFPAAVSETSNVRFIQNDMLRQLAGENDQSCDLVFSAWAIGYSVPAKIIAEASRVLRPGGTLAVIVNRLGTMPAVFAAFRKTMRAFPASLEKAVWPRFPRGVSEIQSHLNRHSFTIQLLEEGIAPITPPGQTNNSSGQRLDWLLGTGVLAGFDVVLPLNDSSDMRRFFERELDAATTGWEHHYIMFIATLAASPCDAHER